MVITVAPEPMSSGDGRRLVATLEAFLGELYPPATNFGDLGEEHLEPAGVFLVARADGVAVGCGGLRRLSPGTAEIKRMFVEPAARRMGVARLLLGELEDRARAFGYERVVLATGTLQPPALSLYKAAGYRRLVEAGGRSDSSHIACFEKVLPPVTP